MAKPLKVVITGDGDKLDRELRRASGSLDKLGKQTRVTGSVTSRGFAGMRVAAVGATAAFGGLALAGKKVADAAIEAEKSQARLRAQLKASGISYQAHAKEIETVIQKTSQLAGLDDEDLQDAFTNIVRVTGDVDKGLRLVGLAADFARGKQIDVAKAGEIVAKVAGGNIGVLGRYGIKVKEGASATEALGMLQQKFAGQAEAYGKTTGGAVDRASVAFENLQETVGAAVAPAIEKVANRLATFVAQMQSGTGAGGRFADAMRQTFEAIKPFAQALMGVAKFAFDSRREILALGVAFGAFKVLGAVVVGFKALRAGIIGTMVVSKLVPAFWALNAAMTANPIGLVVVGLSALAGGLVYAYTKSKTFREVVAAAFTGVRRVAADAFDVITFGLRQFLVGIGRIAGAASRLPGMGWLKGVSEAALRAAAKLKNVGDAIRGVPSKKKTSIEVQVKFKGLGALLDQPDSLSKRPPVPLGDAIGREVTRRVPKTITRRAPFLSGGSGSGLKGARAALAPIAGLGSRFGLGVTSGKRPGARTSSGNQSWHATGEAIDLAGPGSGMLRFFNYMKATWGARLAELIYTPGGAGIKNGRAHRYSGQVAADHFDHVHVAMDLGRPGQGDGYGKGQIRNLWTRAGGSAEVSNLAAAVALAESGGDPNVVSSTGDVGLWQINRATWGKLATKDPLGNARAAVKISSGGRNWRPWVAFTNGSYKRFLGGGGSTGGASAPTVDRRESQERAGSRLVNRIVSRGLRGTRRDARAQSAIGGVIEDAEGGYGRTERFFGQVIGGQPGKFGEEDLGTAEGRAARISELGELKKLKAAQLARMRKRAAALKRLIVKHEKTLKSLHAARKKARGAKRAKISERMKPIEDELIDYKAELRALGGQIADTQLDIGDLTKDIQDVAATPDTEAPEGPTYSATDKLGEDLKLVDLQERAELLTAEQAAGVRKTILSNALAGFYGGLSEHERLEVMAQLIESQKAATEAQQAATQASQAHTAAVLENTAVQKARLALAERVTATVSTEAVAAFADLMAGRLGAMTTARTRMPGTGQLSRL